MAELALRAVVCTRRLSNEKNINPEKSLQIDVCKLKDKASKKITSTKNMESGVYKGEKSRVFVSKGSSKVAGKAGHAQEEDFEDEGVGTGGSNNISEGSDPGSEGDRKKRCCGDRYDSSESSDR